MTQGPHNATSTDLPPSSEPVVHDSSSLGKFLLQRECKFLDSIVHPDMYFQNLLCDVTSV